MSLEISESARFVTATDGVVYKRAPGGGPERWIPGPSHPPGPHITHEELAAKGVRQCHETEPVRY